MNAINPLETAEAVTETYALYLKSLIKPRREEVAKALAACIDESVASDGGIVKGPFLEATPPYETGKSLAELINEGVISKEFAHLNSQSLPLGRPLYAHQESAIRKVAAGRNILVATGTGSGKTESFMLPILNNLMDEKSAGTLGPGVRALLLYPMNALANDQVKRLRELLVNYPSITFGRYTGETPETEKIARESYFLAEGKYNPPNELISREQIRDTPPNILLTNYAMLEYLLLRPNDITLFEAYADSIWKFIVADEAHTYDGAHGIEVATLLRKLRERVDPNHTIQTIGTTATIGGTGEEIEKFASSFFDNKFEIANQTPDNSDLVTPRRKAIDEGTWGPLAASDWLDTSEATDFSSKYVDAHQSPADRFRTEKSVAHLREVLFEGPLNVAECAAKVFGSSSESAQQAVTRIVQIGAAIKDASGNQALSARFHLFARSTEGIFGCLSSSPHLYLSRRVTCEKCANLALEMAGCNKCGATFFVGFEQSQGSNRYFKAEGKSGTQTFLMPEDLELSDENEDDDLIDHDQSLGKQQQLNEVYLCIKCGRFFETAFAECSDCPGSQVIKVKTQTSRNKCAACGCVGFPAIRKLESGNDAAASVLATELYQHMPASQEGLNHNLPGNGRKLMVFSDNRQQAAYFAPYLEDRYGKILWRKIVYKSLETISAQYPNELTFALDDLVPHIVQHAEEANLFETGITNIGKNTVAHQRLHFEITNTETKNNLEGIGLVVFEPKTPENPAIYSLFGEFGLTSEQGRDLIVELLNTLRLSAIVSAENGVQVDADLFKPRTGPIFIRETDPVKGKKTTSWSPKAKSNTRADYLRRVLAQSAPEKDAGELLAKIWMGLVNPNGVFAGVLETKQQGVIGVLSQLNHKNIVASLVSPDAEIYECDKCGRVTARSIFGICPRYRCTGSLVSSKANIQDKGLFYSRQYQSKGLISLKAREHTAQLTTEEARDIQNAFVRGKVNLLSSSTTFELGVDVGELQSVFLRNVPPSVANYLQRAGRAGRRADSAALILTYAQRKPHDLSKYGDPVSMVAGKMRSPFVELENERILQRHVYSVFFASYFRSAAIDTKVKAGGFFLEGDPDTHAEKIATWLDANDNWLKLRFDSILPLVLSSRNQELWSKTINDFKSLVSSVKDKLSEEIAEYDTLIAAARSKNTAKGDFEAGSLRKVKEGILSKDMISFLSKSNLIPKYGFPVDTVALQPRRQDANAEKVDLDRDLSIAIFEYAPGSTVVAAGYTWESVGLGYVPSKEFRRMQYAKCGNCEHYNERIFSTIEKLKFCEACSHLLPLPENYIIPEWGFVASGGVKRPGESPRLHASSGRSLYLSSEGTLVPSTPNSVPGGKVTSELRTIADLVVVNSGPSNSGFQVCPSCKAAFPGTQASIAKHNIPSSPDRVCSKNVGERLHLGHKYQTDIVLVNIDVKGSNLQANSLAKAAGYALLEGASNGLQIAHDDIDVIPLPSTDSLIRLALVDAVPAGAGFAKLIAENIHKVFDYALERVENCECGNDTSCYECLRTYRNQRDHESLKRKDAVDVLQFVLRDLVPEIG
jgi:ATP-dependent helicase YprA (DUF1998 family)